jgi:hypothetical protein
MSFFFDEEKNCRDELVTRISRACEGLFYISETDAPVTVFAAERADTIDAATIRALTNSPKDARVEERDFHKFFARLTKSEAWHLDAQREQTKKFLELQTLLEEDLRELKVFKIGEIQLTIYVVGLDTNNNVVGVSTEAVET